MYETFLVLGFGFVWRAVQVVWGFGFFSSHLHVLARFVRLARDLALGFCVLVAFLQGAFRRSLHSFFNQTSSCRLSRPRGRM